MLVASRIANNSRGQQWILANAGPSIKVLSPGCVRYLCVTLFVLLCFVQIKTQPCYVRYCFSSSQEHNPFCHQKEAIGPAAHYEANRHDRGFRDDVKSLLSVFFFFFFKYVRIKIFACQDST